jgi:predicted nucleotidyltransferase
MTTLAIVKEKLRNHQLDLSSRFGLSKMAIFGSYGRGQQRTDSDIDILVEFNRPIGLEFIDLAEELERILGERVDLVSRNGIKASYFREIEAELTYV